jgi:hypothetical protein
LATVHASGQARSPVDPTLSRGRTFWAYISDSPDGGTFPSSIARGQARHETRDFLQQLSYADGYLAERETQLLLSVELGFCPESDAQVLLKEIDELQRMLTAISRKLASGSPLATRHSLLPQGEAKDSL